MLTSVQTQLQYSIAMIAAAVEVNHNEIEANSMQQSKSGGSGGSLIGTMAGTAIKP